MKINYTVLLFYFILLPFLANSAEKVQLMPTELINHAAKNGCYPVDDFYILDGNIDAPFVYGIAKGDKWKSAAYWCQKDKTKDFNYRIMIYLRDNSVDFSCNKSLLVDSISAPIGLSVIEKKWDLSTFKDNQDKLIKSPKKFIFTKALIMENIYNITLAYICYEGIWYNSLLKH